MILFICFILLLAAMMSNQIALREVLAATDQRAQARKLLVQSLVVLSTLQQAETAQRGYLLTGKKAYLAPYQKAKSALPEQLNQLSELSQQGAKFPALNELTTLANQKIEELASTIETHDRGGAANALAIVQTDQGHQLMIEIRKLIDDQSHRVLGEVTAHANAVRFIAGRIQLAGWIGGGIVVLVIGFLFFYLQREARSREEAIKAVERAERTLREEYEANKRLQHQFQVVVEGAPGAIVLVDEKGCIQLANRQLEQLFGYSREELLGQKIECLLPDSARSAHTAHRQKFTEAPSSRRMGQANQTFYGQRKDSSEFPVDIGLNPIQTPNGPGILAVITDLTERKLAEEQLERALKDKTVLLNEVHHRVKNNLQVVSSLLDLQTQYSTSPEAHEALTDSKARIKAMALIHQLVHERHEFDRVNLVEYLRKMGHLLYSSFVNARRNIRLHVDVPDEPVYLELNRVIPCALFINEVVSNSFKYAFPETQAGDVNISLRLERDNQVVLIVSDNGLGLPEDFKIGEGNSLGTQLIPLFVDQLHGSLDLKLSPGVTYELRFTLTTH